MWRQIGLGFGGLLACVQAGAGETEWWKQYSPPCVERENVFEFTDKPTVRSLGQDKYEITFAVKSNCDVTVSIVDPSKELVPGRGTVVRHLAAGVLGPNAPAPLQKNSLKQTLLWNGKDDLDNYVDEPGKLKVRVSLGLKPVWDKLLGPSSPKALPGRVWGIAADADGVYVFARGRQRAHVTCRKFDHDGRYVAALWPPPANLPEDKLGGMGYVEYEPGKRSLHGAVINWSVWHEGYWMPPTIDGGAGVLQCRPVAAGGKVYFLSSGFNVKDAKENESGLKGPFKPKLYYINTDGSTESAGIVGRVWCEIRERVSSFPHIEVSPDGKTLYAVHMGIRRNDKEDKELPIPALLAGPLQGTERAKVLVGDIANPGSDDKHFSGPYDVACDAAGRVYVADRVNNRIQVFAPDGKFLKTLKVSQPRLVQVHRKTGEIYVSHKPSDRGESVWRVSVFGAFPDMAEKRHWDGIKAAVMTLDSWSTKPRLWIGDESWDRTDVGSGFASEVKAVQEGTIRVFEDDGKSLNVICDFGEDVRREAGDTYVESWEGGYGDKLACDPVRETVCVVNSGPPDPIYDLKTGKLRGTLPLLRDGKTSEVAFDKRGYMHIHTDYSATGNRKVVVRLDADRALAGECTEVPYNYGEGCGKWRGAILTPVTDSQAWSWGMGVNMRGDVALVVTTEWAPKFQDEADKTANLTELGRMELGVGMGRTFDPYKEQMRQIAEWEKKGEDLFFLKPRPGIALHGATIWTWNAGGEIRSKGGVVAGGRRVTGVQIDEDGFVYFPNSRYRMKGDKPFLFERGGNYGGGPYEQFNRTPFFGTFIKTRGSGVDFILSRPPIPLEPLPARPPDLAHPLEGGFAAYGGEQTWEWVETAEWMYAGASPIVGEHCDCAQMRASLDWYKRSFVPECYRHSVGVLDSAGNLICHVGQYGNFDSGAGPGSKVPLGGDGIATTRAAYVGTTDNYLCMDDWGQRLVVARLDYHIEETAGIAGK